MTRKPPLWAAIAVSLGTLVLYAVLRLYVYDDRNIPLTYALPLFLGLWHKNRPLHYASMVVYCILAAIQVFVVLQVADARLPRSVSYLMMLINIGTVGIITDLWVVSQERIRASYRQLQQSNAELEATNKAIVSRDEEIKRQNVALQEQKLELERQIQQSQQHSDELAQLADELRRLHEESKDQQQFSMRLQKELDDRIAQAEDASRRKTRFLSAISHDVRTPANAISLMAEVIKLAGQNDEMIQEVPQLAEALKSNAKLLVELVSDVLDLSRFDSNTIDLDESEFNIGELILAEVNQHQPIAAAAGLELQASPPVPPIWIRSDRMKLARVLGNLIGNAVKFTLNGKVQVNCLRSDQGVEIQVQDTGVGIREDHLAHIFDEFYQINNPERDRTKGTGLGLAICKRLVDAMHCSFRVESQVRSGSTFAIQIPKRLVIDGGMEVVPVVALSHSVNRLAGLRALVVEDHDTTRVAVAILLSAQGAKVDQAADGRSALRFLSHQPPDVLLLDMMLPDMDGRIILGQLAEKWPPALRCLLVVSGDVSESRRNEVLKLGAHGIVAKPVQMDTLIDRICEELSKRQSAG